MSESSKQYSDSSVLLPNKVRHTFASWLVRKGVSLFEVSRMLVNSTIKIAERYAHLEPRESAADA
jgi:site-specific recombinase XerD